MSIPRDMDEKKKLSAVCGLFCPSCTVYIGTQEDPPRLKAIAGRFQLPVEEWECEGCRSERRSYYCRNNCKMVACAAEKGIEFCGECDDYPCEELKKFQAERPHRIELWESQRRIAEIGFSEWFEEMVDHYSCPKCRTINSAYDRVCRVCGSEPSCRYVQLHQGEIDKSLIRSK
ncbi:MAG: DUF3795 domain-containing protein [Deltaproteobacteria bacterium]|nr:DUF3795 domain-containing protein [Deltaproteobacteria bacterium]